MPSAPARHPAHSSLRSASRAGSRRAKLGGSFHPRHPPPALPPRAARGLAHATELAWNCAQGVAKHFADTGPIIGQSAVPVLPDDDEDDLRDRILAEEHRLLPTVVRAVAAGQVTVEGRRVRVAGATLPAVPHPRSLDRV